MSNVQKKLAARTMKCGIDRVWIDPTSEKVRKAITRSDIRRFIKEGLIKKFPVKTKAKNTEKRKQRAGSRKGRRSVREGKKESWLKIIRPQRKLLRELMEKEQVDKYHYRKLYLLIKGGKFRTKKHLLAYLKDNKMLMGAKK